MVTIKDGCGCGTASCCSWKEKLEEAYKRATASVNKVGDFDGAIYYPDGSGFVKLPIPRQSEIQLIHTNKDDIDQLKVEDIRLQANIDAEKTARIVKDENLDSDVARIDATDARQSELIQDNADRINSTYNDLVATEATVATHDSDIITLKANNQTLARSLVSDVIMTDGTTAGSVQVSIEREDGALITSANYKWGRDIGVRLEAGTQAGYIKTVISLSDGTELVSNEYKIVEVLESDVYVTAITLVPDMTAGTIGGNISYSNGTTQTINSVSVPTAPGVTSAIEALQGRMTAVEQKNTQQDASISSLNSRVQAIEDTPGVGQFGAGKLGTIAGSAVDGRVAAEDDGTGSVNGWSALKTRVTTAEGQITTAQNNISALDGTVAQQTTDISGLMTDVTNLQNKDSQQDQSIAGVQTALDGKVNVAQGAANAGKALVVGEDGNVALIEPSVSDKIPGGILNLSTVVDMSSASSSSSCVTFSGFVEYYLINSGGTLDINTKVKRCLINNASANAKSISKPDNLDNAVINDLNLSLLPNGNYSFEFYTSCDDDYYIRTADSYNISVNNGIVEVTRSPTSLNVASSRKKSYNQISFIINKITKI